MASIRPNRVFKFLVAACVIQLAMAEPGSGEPVAAPRYQETHPRSDASHQQTPDRGPNGSASGSEPTGAKVISRAAPGNDTCPNELVLACESCVEPFDTTSAGSEGQSFGVAGQVYNDVWFKYTVPQPGGCSSGRVAVSTIGACFNSKVQLLRVTNCFANQTTQCTVLSGMSTIGGGSFVPLVLEVGPPTVNLGPFVYGRNGPLPAVPGAVNGCFKIRVGGVSESDFGAGVLGVDFVCTSPQSGFAWTAESGRCCFPDGSCMITPLGQSGATPICCASLGGFHRYRTDFYEGRTPPQVASSFEIDVVGCSTLPCPLVGEACYNARNLNAALGNDVGRISNQSTDRVYYRYTVPSAPVGSGIVLDTCASFVESDSLGSSPVDLALAVYRGFNLTTGECDGTSGLQACIGTAFDSSEAARARNCGPHEGVSCGADGAATCFGPDETSACICLKVVGSGNTPQVGEVRQGETIYIGIGAQKTRLNGDSPRAIFDPFRSECGVSPVNYQLQVSTVAACYSCDGPCPEGALSDPEPLPMSYSCVDYVDVVNAGCTASIAANQTFTPITCGTTYCGSSATYQSHAPCAGTSEFTCPNGDEVCIGFICHGPAENSRDDDWFRLYVAEPQRLTWTINASFPAAVQIIHSPSNNCLDLTVLSSASNLAHCGTVVARADVCVGWVYLLVSPAYYDGGVPCGSRYYATLTCDAPSLSATNCCKGDMNNDGMIDGLDIRLWSNQLLPIAAGGDPSQQFDPSSGCFDPLNCRADMNNDYAVSLADITDFVGALLMPIPCPSPQCGDEAACHLPSGNDSGGVGDLSVSTTGGGFRLADDFKVITGSNISQVCWYGFYYDYNTMDACNPQFGDSADSFALTVYADAGGLPGKVLEGPVLLTSVNKTDSGADLLYLSKNVRRFKYEVTLPTTIAVTPGTCYWIEIVNTTTGGCIWHWETSSTMGNGLSVNKAGGPPGTPNWFPYDVGAEDFAFCLPGLRIDHQDCGLPPGRCCVYPPMSQSGDCSVQTRPICEVILGGRWTQGADCSGPCPIIPSNDECADALLIATGPTYSGSTLNATRDGPAMQCEYNCGDLCNSANDVWYKWVASFSGNATFTMCDSLAPVANKNGVSIVNGVFGYDSLMVVYTNCPNLGGNQIPAGCNDDSCFNGPSTVSQIVATTIVAGQTYWIRISGWQGANGDFVLRVSQP